MGTEENETPFRWEVRLWTRDPAKISVIILSAVIAGLAGFLIFHQLLLALIGFGAILASTTDYWLPQKFTLDRNSASMRCGISVTSIEWKDVKRVIEDDAGVRLTPLSKDNRLSAFRGVYLRFSNNRDEVLQTISHNWGQDV